MFDAGSLVWVALVVVFFWLSEAQPRLRDAGMMDNQGVAHGQWWRLFTATLLHTDLAHLTTNAVFGALLLGLAMGRFGTGIGLLAAFFAGAGGNATALLISPENHRSLGASGMVMGALGLLAAQSFSDWRRGPLSIRGAIAGVAGGIMLFVLLGLTPGTDIAAHSGGFFCGLLLGMILSHLPRLTRSGRANLFAGLLFGAITILAWWKALK
jgi:membrane associated rhomboid family serine protease